MKLRRVMIIIFSLLFVAIVAGTSLSILMVNRGGGSEAQSSGAAPLIPVSLGTPKISFAAGTFPVDVTELTLVLQPGETELLDGLTQLRTADFSGSGNCAEIAAWAQAHPEVSVRYTVRLPDGSVVDNETEALDMSAYNSEQLSAALELLPCLPRLGSIELGSRGAADALRGEDLSALQEVCPDVSVSYAMQLNGQRYTLDTTAVDLSGLSHDGTAEAAAVLACLPNVTEIRLGDESGGLSWADIGQIHDARPEAALDYGFTLWGQGLNLSDETLNFSHIQMNDEGAAVRAVLPYMTRCTTLDMDSCGVSNGSMAAIRQDFPDIHVIWRVWFGLNYSVRTDAERILASKPSVGGVVDDGDARVLQYCDGCKYLDLGHNEDLTNIEFVRGMPNLEVLVIAMNPITSLAPLADCHHLEYLETQTTSISDLSPLSGLTELRHLNIARCEGVSDISPLFGLTDLERLWIGCVDPVPAEQVETMRQCAPYCEIDTEVYDPTTGRWRVTGYTELSLQLYAETGWLQEVLHPRYELLREQFGYRDSDFAFYWNDPLY